MADQSPAEAAIAATVQQLMASAILATKNELARPDGALAALQTKVEALAALQARVEVLERQVAAPPAPAPTPLPAEPPPVPEPPPAAADSPDGARIAAGGELRWQGSVWTIVGGKLRCDGATTEDVSLTAGVLWLEIRGARLVHGTVDGNVWAHTGGMHWQLIGAAPAALSVTIEGELGVPRA